MALRPSCSRESSLGKRRARRATLMRVSWGCALQISASTASRKRPGSLLPLWSSRRAWAITWIQGPSRKRATSAGIASIWGSSRISRAILAASRLRCSAWRRASMARRRSSSCFFSRVAQAPSNCSRACANGSWSSMGDCVNGPTTSISGCMKLSKPWASRLSKARLRSVISCNRRRAGWSLSLKNRGSASASFKRAGSSDLTSCCTGQSRRSSRSMLSSMSAITSMLKAWPSPALCGAVVAAANGAAKACGPRLPSRSIMRSTWFISWSASKAAGTVMSKSGAGAAVRSEVLSNSRENRSEKGISGAGPSASSPVSSRCNWCSVSRVWVGAVAGCAGVCVPSVRHCADSGPNPGAWPSAPTGFT